MILTFNVLLLNEHFLLLFIYVKELKNNLATLTKLNNEYYLNA